MPGNMYEAGRAARSLNVERLEWNGGKDLRFQYISVGETVVMKEDAVPSVPFAELEAEILEMYAEKESRTVNQLLCIISTTFVPRKVSCLLVQENEGRRKHRLDAAVIVQTKW